MKFVEKVIFEILGLETKVNFMTKLYIQLDDQLHFEKCPSTIP